MRGSLRAMFATIALVLAATTAVAQLTVSTDDGVYTTFDVVTITIHNAGPSRALFVSSPPCFINRLDTLECVYGCYGLPVLWEMGVGETITVGYDPDEDAVPDPIGWYRVELVGASGDPGSILHCDYRLVEVVPNDHDSWGGVKALYR